MGSGAAIGSAAGVGAGNWWSRVTTNRCGFTTRCGPDAVHVCDGSKGEYDQMMALLLKSGSATPLLLLKRMVKKMIEEENPSHPLTDDQIAKRLDDEGIHVTRRTVAKYREDMRIPSTHQRRVKP